jgi:peptide/nickel transport system substrate-binding protein
MRRPRRILALILVLALSGLAACTGAKGTGTQTDELRIGTSAAPSSMDPTQTNEAAIPEALLYNVYETLVKLDSDGKIRPLLAKEWDTSADGKTYTFRLQSGAKFASGDPVDADAVVKSFERIKNDAKVTDVSKSQMAVVSSVTATAKDEVVVKLDHPSNEWLYDMTGSAGIIFDPSGFDNLATQTAGSGPYELKQWNKNDSVVLQKNPNYWGTPGRFDQVTFKYYSDPNAENNAMLSGDLDIISNVAAPQQLSLFSDTSKYQVIKGVTNGEIVLGFNFQNTALQNLKVRQAINYAIDRQALMNSVWAGQGVLIGSMVPPTDPWYQDLSSTYNYDPAKAKELLAEAGYSSGLSLRLRVPTLPYATDAATFIASELKAVGINVTVDELEFPARWIDEVMTQSNYDMTIVAHVEGRDIVKFADPTYYWHYNNAQFQQLITQADEAPNTDDQNSDMQQAAKILADDAAADFLWLLPSLKVARADLTGIPENQIQLSFDLSSIASKNS